MEQFLMEPVMVAQSAFNTTEVKIATSSARGRISKVITATGLDLREASS